MSAAFHDMKGYTHHGLDRPPAHAQGEQCESVPASPTESVFPFSTTPSGNFKVNPQQIVFKNNKLSIVAANPVKTKIKIKNYNKESLNCTENEKMLQKDVFKQMQFPSSQLMRRLPVGSAPPGDHADTDYQEQDYEFSQLQNDEYLNFGKGAEIDWSTVILPAKTGLLDLLHDRISNYINPDIRIRIDDYEYRCHMLVLQCYSDFFVENAAPLIEIPKSRVTTSAFVYIYHWMLLGEDSYTVLRRDNILEIFMAAQYLQMKELEDQCWAFLDDEQLFSEDKAFMLFLDAKKIGNMAIMELMVPRIQRFFLTLVSSKDFIKLPVEDVVVFLTSNYICINCEMEVFMSGVRWLTSDWDRRKRHLLEVMSCVRFGLISPWQLVDIRRNSQNKEFLLLTRHPAVSEMIDDGMAFAVIKSGRESSDNAQSLKQLGLTKPVARNWTGITKTYHTYSEFLMDLSRYQQMHLAERGTGDSRPSSSSGSLHSELID